jgi:hypothetical protein
VGIALLMIIMVSFRLDQIRVNSNGYEPRFPSACLRKSVTDRSDDHVTLRASGLV